VYCVARLGVTGDGEGEDRRLAAVIGGARRASALPALVGFGIRSGDDARRAAALADGVVVGSALVRRLAAAADPVGAAAALGRELRRALGGAPAGGAAAATHLDPPGGTWATA
jgi:tryptophan synthase alpha chain